MSLISHRNTWAFSWARSFWKIFNPDVVLLCNELPTLLVGPERIELPRCSLKRRVLSRLSYGPGGSPWNRTKHLSVMSGALWPFELESRWLGELDLNQRDPISKTGACPSQPPPNNSSIKIWNTRLDSNQRHRFRRPRPDPLDHGCVLAFTVVLPERIELSSADYRSAALPLSYGSVENWCGVLESNQGHPLCRSGTLPA